MLIHIRKPRIPESCPDGFLSRYIVKPGDTMYLIAKRLGISLTDLITANPHIINPNQIYPGDVLCVPFDMFFPCCTILGAIHPFPPVPIDAWGVALTRLINNVKEQAVSILAVGMAPPSDYGNFDAYEGFINIPDIGGFGFRLFPTPENPPAWTGTITIGPFLTTSTTVKVRTSNLSIDIPGRTILEGALNLCSLEFLTPIKE